MMRTETRREAALIVLLCACVIAPAGAQIRPDTPLIILVEQPTIVYTPTGERIAIPAGAEIDVCSKDGVRLAYDRRVLERRCAARI